MLPVSAITCHPPCMHATPSEARARGLFLSLAPAAQKLNNASYSNRINNDRWTPQETELFFRVSLLTIKVKH